MENNNTREKDEKRRDRQNFVQKLCVHTVKGKQKNYLKSNKIGCPFRESTNISVSTSFMEFQKTSLFVSWIVLLSNCSFSYNGVSWVVLKPSIYDVIFFCIFFFFSDKKLRKTVEKKKKVRKSPKSICISTRKLVKIHNSHF